MSAITPSTTSFPKDVFEPDDHVIFTRFSKKKPSIKKKYTLDPKTLGLETDLLGKGTFGSVMRANFNIHTTDGHSKEKHYALKKFKCLWDNDEFTCHQGIIEKIGSCSEILNPLKIVPQTGIEEVPLFAFCQNGHKFIVKRLYNMDLTEAIHSGYISNKNLLLSGSIQLLEGLITLMSIGALYFDLKPKNILVGRNSKFEFALSDFGDVQFLNFNDDDKKIIKYTPLTLSEYLTPDQELLDLEEIQKREKPAKEFIEKLHKLYAFVMGAIFFEMGTQMVLKDFILLKDLIYFLSDNGASSLKTNELWERGCKAKSEEEINALIDEMSIGTSYTYPTTDALYADRMRDSLYQYLLFSGTPKFYAELVIRMLNPDSDGRINVYEALEVLRTHETPSKNPGDSTKMSSQTEETKQPPTSTKRRAKVRNETNLNTNKCHKPSKHY